jgi:hypothetical protein
MKSARTIVASALLLTLPLAACNGLHTPSAAENGGKKVAQAAAKARALANRITHSPDAVGKTLPGDGEGSPEREVSQPLLAPAEAAKELRQLASEVASAGGTEAQRRDAKALATRMRRDAMMLDLMDLERVASLKGQVAWDIGERIAMVQAINASGDLNAATQAGGRVRAMRGARDSYSQLLQALQSAGEQAKQALQPIDADIASKGKDAEQLDAEIQSLRLRSATGRAAESLPLMVEARQKLDQAQDLRMAAASADRDAQPLRSEARIVDAALQGADETSGFLGSRVDEAEKAEEGAKTRTTAAQRRAMALAGEAAELAKEFTRLQSELFEPAVKSVEENMQEGDLASKASTDAAMIALMKARFAAIRADAVDQGMALAMAAAASAGADGGAAIAAMRSERTKFIDAAKASLVEARNALSGVDATQASGVLGAVNELAAALGVDITSPAAPAEGTAPAEGEAPAGDGAAAPAEGEAPAAEGGTPADPAPAEPAPAEPAPADPAPSEPADPAEPNK